MSVTGRGFQIEYPSITLHAISRNESGSSIYCQLDETPAGDQPAHEEDDTPMRELKIVPERVQAREFTLVCAPRLSRKLLCSLS
jgi:nucleotide-sensitive chloride channel 1A